MRWPQLLRRNSRRSRRRLRFEPLEDRRLMACLSIGVTLHDDPVIDRGGLTDCIDDSPRQAINVGKVGGLFALDVRVQDRTERMSDMGVIALPVDIEWDRGVIEFVGDPNASDLLNPIVTSNFPLQRALNPASDLSANLRGLRGAALPSLNQGSQTAFGSAIGANAEDVFSELSFQASRVAETPFTIRLAGSMSFADAAVLDPVVGGSNAAAIDNITVRARLIVDPVIVSGTKFNDENNNGARDAGELGLANWTIRLIRDQNNNGVLDDTDPVITTGTTGSDGAYQLTVTESGTYFVREVNQPGWVQTTPNPLPITTSGVDVDGVDFGNNKVPVQNSLSGFVFADTNLNGLFDAGEDGLPNVTIQLQRTDVAGAMPVTTLTGPDGWYHFEFEDLPSGIYDVTELQPAGFSNASISRGLVFPLGATQPSDPLRGVTVGFNKFQGIDLSAGGNAVDFNFGDNVIPTKRRFVASVDPFAETCSALGLNCVTVRGTTGDDQIEFVPDTEVVRVTVNNQPAQVFPRDTVHIVKIDALAGQDTVTLRGGSTNDVAHSQSNSCTVQTGAYRPGDYAVLAVNAERKIFDGGLGNDLAVLRDSAVDEVLTATNEPFIGPVMELQSAQNMQRFVRAVAFERTRAVSIPRVGSNDIDTATLNGLAVELVGKWQTVAQP